MRKILAFLALAFAISLPAFGAITINTSTLEITITPAARERIAGESLTTVMMQAASQQIFDADGDSVGFMLLDIDAGSPYDLAGLRHGDIVTHIDDAHLKDPRTAVDYLRYVRSQPDFSYTVLRNGTKQRYRVRIQD